MGEFGAVSVVSGHIRGLTNTLPLHVEILYNEYNFQAAFAVASLLAFLALVTAGPEKPGREYRPTLHRARCTKVRARPKHEHRHQARQQEVRARSPRCATSASRCHAGELVALLGPSGCGKTTLLRIIAGLERPMPGTVLFDGEDASRRSAKERRVGFVFQHYALFRHMTVFENVAFGLRVRPRRLRPSKTRSTRR